MNKLSWVLSVVFLGVLFLTSFLLYKYFSFQKKTKVVAIETTSEREIGPKSFLHLNNQIEGYKLELNNAKALEELLIDWGTNTIRGANYKGDVVTISRVTLSLFDRPLISIFNNEGEELNYYNINWKNPLNGQIESLSQAHIGNLDNGNLKFEIYINSYWLKNPVDIFTGEIRQGSSLSGNSLVNYLINYQLLNMLFGTSLKEVRTSVENSKLENPYSSIEISDNLEGLDGSYIVGLTEEK